MIDQNGYVYLASPYSHSDPAVREARFTAACRAANDLMIKGYAVFSPIAHSHPIDEVAQVTRLFDFWSKQDIPLLRHSTCLVVLMLDGWLQSKGVEYEINLARSMGLPIEYMAEYGKVVKK